MCKGVFLLLFVIPFASAAGKTTQMKDGIYYMQKEDFDTVLADKRFAVFFHYPWTDQSVKVLFEFQKSAGLLSTEDLDMNFGVVDMSENDFTGHRFGVDGNPTIKFFHETKPYDYDGNFTYVSIAETVRKHAKSDWTPTIATGLVLELNTVEEFEAHIRQEKLTLVDFYAPWCNHCKQLEPVLDKVASKLGELDRPVSVAKINIDGNANSALFDRYKMKGYPYVFLFLNGKEILYEGPKNVPQLVDFVKEHMTTIMTVLDGRASSGYTFSDTKKATVVVGYFSSRSAYEYSMFSEVAEMFRKDKDIHFGHVIGSDSVAMAQKEYGFDNEDYGVAVIRDRRLPQPSGGKRYSVFAEDPFEKDSLRSFITDNRQALVGYAANQKAFRRVYGKNDNITVVFMDVDWDQDTRDAMVYRMKIVADVAKKFPSMKFVAVDHTEMHTLKDFVGLGDNDNDMSAAIFHQHKVRFPLDGECTTASLSAHVQDYQDGKKLVKFFKSQDPPTRQTSPIKTLVRSNLDEVMADGTRDVAIVFITPWNNNCKKFMPVLKKAHGILNAESVDVYKYDVTLNDQPDGVSGDNYPVLRMYPAGNDRMGRVSTYSGPRNSNSIANWIQESADTLETEDGSDEETVSSEEAPKREEL